MPRYRLTSTYTVTVERIHDTKYGVSIETAMDTESRKKHLGTDTSAVTVRQSAVCTDVQAELVDLPT